MLFPHINEFKFTHPYFKHPLGSGGRKSKGFDQNKKEVSDFEQHLEDGDAFACGHPDLADLDEESNSYMGLSDSVICHSEAVAPVKSRVRKGKPMTGDARRTVKEACAILQEQVGKENLAFLTLTLPGLSASDLVNCNESFPELMRRFCQELKRTLVRAGLCEEYICITEIQEKRWRNRCEVALHSHLVFQSRKNRQSHWKISKQDIREIWERVLSNFFGYQVQCPYATRIESIKKDVARYLGKYMSKGGQVVNEIIEAGRRDELPGKWDRIADSLRRKVKQGLKYFTRDAKIQIAYNLEQLKEQGILKWYYEVKADFSKETWFKKWHGEPIRVVSICGEIAKGYENCFEFQDFSNLSICQNI